MLRLDRNDPLDRMILKELSGTPVLFDEWLDAMAELEDEPDCIQILQEKGLCREDVLRDARACRADFHARLEARGLPVDDRLELCFQINEQAQAEPSMELLRVYCELLCDSNFLLDAEPQDDDPDEREADEDQIIGQYLSFLEDRDELLQTLLQRRELARKFAEVTKQNRSPRPVSCDTERKYEILQCFTTLFELPEKGSGHVLLNNLANYMQIAAASPVLRSVEPLLLFRLLTRRQSYMCSTPDLTVNLSALWKPDGNKVDTDNGRNFKQYRTYLRLFIELCGIYRKDESIDLPLCWYGLDQITVLGDFYRNKISKGWEYADTEPEMQFIPTVEELVEDNWFCCFENGCGDNILLTDSGLSYRELEKLQCSENPLVIAALNRLSDYMNTHAARLTEKFLQADAAGVKALCRNVLERAKVTISASDIPLYLASINEALMELKDYYANDFLVQAGHALTDYENSSTD